jgi:hypothetical protein
MPKTFIIYLSSISLLGIAPGLWGLVQIPAYESKPIFFALLLVVILSQIVTTSVPVSEKTGITYSVAPVFSMATLPLFGPMAAAFVEAISVLSLWLFKPVNKPTWKKSGKQLAFNTGMSGIAIVVAGWVFLLLRSWLNSQDVIGAIVPWLLAALVYEQVNLWLLLIILRLQHGSEFNMLQMWRQNKWPTSFNIIVLSLGGGLLAFSVNNLDWIGAALFLVPVLLSAYLFHLFVNKKG